MATAQMTTAMRTPTLMAESAEPDRARYRDKSRRARRMAMGAFRPTRASRARKNGAMRMIPAISAMNAGISQITPLLPAAPEAENMKNPMTSAITPGTNERWICRGGAGRPANAATTGTRVMARAGGQPRHQAQREAHHGAHGADDDAVGPQHEPDITVRRPHGLEHPEGAQPALRQHREAADRHQRDEQHA